MIFAITYQSEDGQRRANIVRKGELSWLLTRWKKRRWPVRSRRYNLYDAKTCLSLTSAQGAAREWCRARRRAGEGA